MSEQAGPEKANRPSPNDTGDDAARSQLIERLDNILNDLHDPALIAIVKAARDSLDSAIPPVGGWSALIRAARGVLTQAEAKIVEETTERTRRTTEAAIILSAEAQARVASNLRAIHAGDAGTLYREEFGPLDEQTYHFVSTQLKANAVVQANVRALKNTPESLIRPVLEHKEECRELLDKLIATASSGPQADHKKRDLLTKIKDKRLFLLSNVQEALKEGDLSNEQLRQLVDDGMHLRAEMAHEAAAQFSGSTYEGQIARQYFGTVDGYAIDYEKLLEAAYSPEGIAARKALAKAGGDWKLIPEEQRPYAVAAKIVIHIDGNYINQSTMWGVMHEIAAAKGEHEVGHDNAFHRINDRSLSFNERLAELEAELVKHHPDFKKRGNLRETARQYLKQIDLLSEQDAERLLKGDDQKAFLEATRSAAMVRREARLRSALQPYYPDAQIDKLLGAVNASPSAISALEAAARALSKTGVPSEELNKAIDVTNDPRFNESLSKIRYYNLADKAEGLVLLNGILHGREKPEDALTKVEQMRKQALASMEGDSDNVRNMLDNEYLSRLQRLGVVDPDGALNVEKVMEKARELRDTLGGTDAAIAARANKKWEDLSESERDQRAVARAAIRYKSIEVVRQFSENLSKALDNAPKNAPYSDSLQADIKLFEQLNDSSNPQAQQAAFDQVLQSQQYLRVNKSLRELVTADMIALVKKNPNVFTGVDIKTGPVDEAANKSPVTDHSREQAFDAKTPLDKREQQGSEGIFDGLSKSNLEKAILGAVQNLSAETRRQIFSTLLNSFNETDPDFISYNEIENAVRGSNKTMSADQILAAIDTNKSGLLSVEEITNYLGGQLANNAPKVIDPVEKQR